MWNLPCQVTICDSSPASDSISYQLVLCGCSDSLTGHSVLFHTLCVFVGKRSLTIVRTSHYFRPLLLLECLWLAVTLCASVWFTCFHWHKVLEGLPSYILRTGSARTDGRDVYGIIRWVPIIVVFDEGTQLPLSPVVTLCPNVGAGGRCWPDSSKLVCARYGNFPS